MKIISYLILGFIISSVIFKFLKPFQDYKKWFRYKLFAWTMIIYPFMIIYLLFAIFNVQLSKYFDKIINK